MAITAKPPSYTVNTGHAKCPDHLWMLDEGSGTSLVDKGKSGALQNLAITNPGGKVTWETDATHGVILRLGASNTSDYASVANSLGITAGTGSGLMLVIGRWNSNNNPSALSTLGSVGMSGNSGSASMQIAATGVLRDARNDTVNPTIANNNPADATDNAVHMYAMRFTDNSGGTSQDGGGWDLNTTTYDMGTVDDFAVGARCGSSKADFMTPDAGETFDVIAVMVWINDYATWSDTWISDLYADPWAFLTTVAPANITNVVDSTALYDGKVVTIDGEGFGAAQGGSTLKLKTADGTPSVTQTVTSWTDTQLTLTLESTALPFGSLNVEVVVSGVTDTYPVTLISAPGYANGVANVPWSVGAGSIFDGASPAVVDGDLYEYETLSDLGASVEVFVDGTFVIGSGVGTHKFDARVYDQTDETWSAFVEQSVSAEESTYDTVYGKAVSGTGVIQTIVLADNVAVPGAVVLKNGIALSTNGYVYVCPWPATMGVGYIGGVAVREDGALIVKDQSTVSPKYYANGIPVSFRGEVAVSTSAPTGIKVGIGRVGDALCVSAF